MGWLELLPLLRRVLPLLDRLAPLLESLVAGRMGGRAAMEANTATLTEASRAQAAELQSSLVDQRAIIDAISHQVSTLASGAADTQRQIASLERHISGLLRMVRVAAAVLALMLLCCLVLLVLLLVRHN